MMSSQELKSRCAATLRKRYGHGGALHAEMGGELLVEALLESGPHTEIVDDLAERVWVWSDLHRGRHGVAAVDAAGGERGQ